MSAYTGKVIVITGASSGIGRAFALARAEQVKAGYWVTGRKPSPCGAGLRCWPRCSPARGRYHRF